MFRYIESTQKLHALCLLNVKNTIVILTCTILFSSVGAANEFSNYRCTFEGIGEGQTTVEFYHSEDTREFLIYYPEGDGESNPRRASHQLLNNWLIMTYHFFSYPSDEPTTLTYAININSGEFRIKTNSIEENDDFEIFGNGICVNNDFTYPAELLE